MLRVKKLPLQFSLENIIGEKIPRSEAKVQMLRLKVQFIVEIPLTSWNALKIENRIDQFYLNQLNPIFDATILFFHLWKVRSWLHFIISSNAGSASLRIIFHWKKCRSETIIFQLHKNGVEMLQEKITRKAEKVLEWFKM